MLSIPLAARAIGLFIAVLLCLPLALAILVSYHGLHIAFVSMHFLNRRMVRSRPVNRSKSLFMSLVSVEQAAHLYFREPVRVFLYLGVVDMSAL
jgi:hypothetical protein